MIKEEEKDNEKVLEYVKSNIDYDFNFIQEILDSTTYWQPEGFVEVEK